VASLGIRFARALYGRWRGMRVDERERLAAIAAHVKESALDARGADDQRAAEHELQRANEQFAAAILESAEADPEIDEIEVTRLREDLRRELERIAGAEIEARRTTTEERRGQAGRGPR
jgi:hypothetical protein